MSKHKIDETFRIPLEDKKFVADVLDSFSIDKEHILIALDELKKNGDSFSTVKVANLLNIPVNSVDSFVALTIFFLHFIAAHGLSLQSLEQNLLEVGCDKDKVSATISKLQDFDESTQIAIGKVYWLSAELISETHYVGVNYHINYNSLEDESGKFIGLAPVVKLKFRVSSAQGESRFVTISESLDNLSIMIKRLQEIYEDVSNDTKKLIDLKDKLICIPSE